MVRGQGSRAPPRGYLRPLPGGCPGSGVMAEEAMASYLYTAYHPYSYRYPPPRGKGGAAGGWRPRGSSGYYSGYGEAAAEYFDNYQRAQLKAILSQVNPNLTPRLRKANTKEVGVQVNPRQDASVQCSLGRRTLLRGRPGPAAPRPCEAQREQELGSPATINTRAVRFPRTIAVYSPVASRRLTAFLEEPNPELERQPQQQDKASAVEEEPAALREQRAAQAAAEAAAVRASWEKPPEVGAEPLGQRSAAPPEPATEASQEQLAEPSAQAGAAEPSAQAGAAEPAAQPAEPPASPQKQQQASAGKTRLRFQFLEQKYGYYHCKACNIRWESAYVWCVQGTNKVYFRQFCRTCQKSYNPYRVEDITCQSCKQTRCTCPVKMRHVDPKRPHRQDLCGRCKGKRLSCDSTFSFKYII
ncbi:zygote arrest protein 1 [Ammospiza caudacuta]|uniref:zygote arrest protein 1 n=1 Tax=Ammospiza caudacuta TaxID=2857398 RepID=UPI0027387068|nr:zygote arrest protein 1 [Ammospiza caudacuta]